RGKSAIGFASDLALAAGSAHNRGGSAIDKKLGRIQGAAGISIRQVLGSDQKFSIIHMLAFRLQTQFAKWRPSGDGIGQGAEGPPTKAVMLGATVPFAPKASDRFPQNSTGIVQHALMPMEHTPRMLGWLGRYRAWGIWPRQQVQPKVK